MKWKIPLFKIYWDNEDIQSVANISTKVNGNFTMACAAWTGCGNFTNNGQNLLGYFKITGVKTDWEGKFNMINQNNSIALNADYILYPHSNKSPDTIKEVKKIYYL